MIDESDISVEEQASALGDEFLRLVGRGTAKAAMAFIDQNPDAINQTGAHPFWGGRPQALHVTVERNKARLFQYLLERGADPSGQNDAYDGCSPLMLAVHWNRDKMISTLLEAGVLPKGCLSRECLGMTTGSGRYWLITQRSSSRPCRTTDRLSISAQLRRLFTF